ncbi:ligand-binding sensor domain-containing protein [Desertivirga brevis]|uniref:ligand-binding sensor domain-containing protein n=1 Tax=Desertivirga brevis TaxID=2810310 RepID=UPI001A95EC76|nr:triple tyrosine motif-containing protein [Pedobacter sp. SYSU D00873]
MSLIQNFPIFIELIITMHKLFLLVLLFARATALAGNPIGLPDIVNYEKTSYNGGTQNWDIQQDRNGIMYFANNEGLLTYDGTYWKIYPLPNKTIVRSIALGLDSRIYAGGQDEFGYFSPATNGKLKFYSLKNKLPEKYRSFADIWDIVGNDKDVYFRTEKAIFHLSNNQVKVIPATSQWVFLGLAGKKVVVQDKQKGLAFLKSGSLSKQFLPLPENFLTTSVSVFSADTVLLTTMNHGIYTLTEGALKTLDSYGAPNLRNRQILQAFRDVNGMLIIATNNNGLLVVNKKGSIVYNFTKNTGLQNSTILSIHEDHNKNLWLGLNDGIDFIASNNAIRHINPDIFAEGVGHSSIIFNNTLYFGLSSAVYSMPRNNTGDISLSSGNIKYTENTGGQTWGFDIVENHLLLGKHEGAYSMSGNSATNFSSDKGYWKFLYYKHKHFKDPILLAGNYNGIDIFSYNSDGYKLLGPVKNFHESARFITVGNDNLIWASHPYKGVYKIDVTNLENPEVKLYTKARGLPSTFNNHVYTVKGRMVICTENGIYEYNKKGDSFAPSEFFTKIFRRLYIRCMKEDPDGNIWFIQDKNLGVCKFSGGKPELIFIPELNGKLVSGFEHINPIDKNNILVGAQKGFYHINFDKYVHNSNSIKVQFSQVRAIGKNDSLLFGGYFGEVNEIKKQQMFPEVKYALNSFHFEYSSIVNKNQANIQYSYYLEGFDKTWSAYSKRTEKDYTNLPYGNFIFKVKARNNFGIESVAAVYRFSISPPWYHTWFAYTIYSLIIAFILYQVYKFQQKKFINQQKRFEEEQRRLEYLHQLEIDKSEKEIVKLKNEKLETEIEAKNSELASIAMHLGQKAELLNKIKGELDKLNKHMDQDEHQMELKKILRTLSSEEKADGGWDQFSIYFDKVHTNFLRDIKSAYPNLTTNDLRLCAYLKMNLTTKEIAQLMQISPRGVEISRYRLRKKLQITGETNLFEFFKDFKLEKRQEGLLS